MKRDLSMNDRWLSDKVHYQIVLYRAAYTPSFPCLYVNFTLRESVADVRGLFEKGFDVTDKYI